MIRLGSSDKKIPAWPLLIMVLIEALDIAALSVPISKALKETFDITARDFSLIFTINLFFNLLTTNIGARLSDRWSPRSVLAVSLLLASVGSLLSALAPSFAVLLVGRAVSGMGIGMLLPALTLLSVHKRSEKQQSLFLGLVGTMFGIAFLLGTPLSALAANHGFWRASYFFLSGLAFICFVFTLFISKEVEVVHEKQDKFDLLGLVLFGLGLGLVSIGITNFDPIEGNLLAVHVGGSFLLGTLVLAVWYFYQKKGAKPIWKAVFDNKVLGRLYLRSTLTGFWEASLGFLVISAAYLISFDRPGATGMILTPILATMAIVSPLWALVLQKFGWQRIWQLGSLAIFIGCSSLFVSSFAPAFFWWGLVFFGLGLAAVLGATLRRAVVQTALVESRGLSLGVLNSSLNLGQVIGSSLWGAMLGSFEKTPTGPSIVFAIYALFALIASIIPIFSSRRATVSQVQQ